MQVNSGTQPPGHRPVRTKSDPFINIQTTYKRSKR